MPDGFGDGLIVDVEVEAFGVEGPSSPSTHIFMVLVAGVVPSFEKIEVARGASDVLGRRAARSGDTARIFDAWFFCFAGEFDDMHPAVAEIIFVEDDERRWTIGCKVTQADVACFEGATIRPVSFVELGSTISQAADIELMKVAVGPFERGLYHLMELSQVEVAGKLEPAADDRLDIDNMDIGLDDDVVGCEHGNSMTRCWRDDNCRRQLPCDTVRDTYGVSWAFLAAVRRR